MTFADLLELEGLRSEDAALCLHKPGDGISRRAILTLAEERPNLFEAYQSTHSRIQETTVRSRRYFASFVATGADELTFLGLYRTTELGIASAEDFLEDSDFVEMLTLVDGHRRTVPEMAQALAGRSRFELEPVDALGRYRKRLVVSDPGGRNYVRLANTTPLEIVELKRKASVVPEMPGWDQLVLAASELAALPRDWAIRLSEWRGIYLITDESDGARYVGAAYGKENLLGRWKAHCAADRGITRELSTREPSRFSFSILERVSPDLGVAETVRKEQSWMTRLRTKQFGLNR